MSTNINMTVSSMADELSQQTLMVNTHVPIVDDMSEVESSEHSEKNDHSADILQQALDEADGYEQSSFNHTQSNILQENIQHLTDHSYIHTTKSPDFPPPVHILDSQNVDSVDNLEITTNEANKNIELQNLQFDSDSCVLVPSTNDLESSSFPEDSQKIGINSAVLSLNSIGGNESVDVFADETVMNKNALVISENPVCSINSSIQTSSIDTLNPQYVFKVKESVLPSSTSLSSGSYDISHLKLPSKQTSAPLGSVENPIQIIQNGNSYHATQMLTQAQLQQISHVLQRQQAKKMQNGGKSVLYDPSTNTRIVCRVVHPSELQNKHSGLESTSKSPSFIGRGSTSRGRGRPKKFLSKRPDEDEKGNSLLSKEERDERKKQRPRTRSGRISKPPSYMVKDYKRIHHLDFDEEAYNDSDGGYSDYHVSDEEGGRLRNKMGSLPPGVTTSKQRNYSCRSCSKAYIGRGGLSRHYRLNPTHGSMPEGEDVSTQDENSNSSLASSILSSSGGNTNSQTNSNLLPQASATFESEGPSSSSQSIPMNQHNSLSERRKSRLREILQSFSEEELNDVVLPKFAQKVPLWDFFLKKCEEKSDGLRIFEMLKEFEKFLAEMQKISLVYLSPASLEEDQGKTIINISSKQIAEALSLERGAYFVKDTSNVPADPTLTANLSIQPDLTGDIIQPHAKRKRVDQNVEDISARLPEQILSDAHEGSNLELPISEETFSVNSDLQRQVNIFSANLSKPDAHSDMSAKSLFDLSSSTTVTPSSLSSGCLSAVNSLKTQNVVFTRNGAQMMQNIQVRKVQLLGSDQSQQQVLARNGNTLSINGFTISPDFNLSDLASSKDLPLNHRQMEVDGTSAMINKSAFETLNIGSEIGVLNSCQRLQQTIGLCSNQSYVQSLPNISHVNNAHINNRDLIIDSQKVSSQTEVSSSSVNCLPLTDVDVSSQNPGIIASESKLQTCLPSDINPSSTVLEENREFEITHNEIVSDVAKASDSSQVLRHLMLPDGQVIGVWSQVENSEKMASEQLVQNYLPGNLIILQNPDGTIQVPNNQNITLETLQTLVSMDQGQTTQTFTTVQM